MTTLSSRVVVEVSMRIYDSSSWPLSVVSHQHQPDIIWNLFFIFFAYSKCCFHFAKIYCRNEKVCLIFSLHYQYIKDHKLLGQKVAYIWGQLFPPNLLDHCIIALWLNVYPITSPLHNNWPFSYPNNCPFIGFICIQPLHQDLDLWPKKKLSGKGKM